jgi:CspA family cold shock protein
LQKLLKINILEKTAYLCAGTLPQQLFQFYLMYTGTVKFFNETKGFGFVVDNTSKEEIFVHVTGLIDNIREGDVVTYNTERGKKGMNAVDVKLA